MKDAERVVVTGATGFLGSHFLLRQLRRGGSACAILRGRSVADARARLLDTLAEVAASYDELPLDASEAARTSVVLGDITLPSCGLELHQLRQLGFHRASFWHFAASLAYRDTPENTISTHNVYGTSHALDCAERLGVSCFVYVSTAYTAGRQIGHIAEVLHPQNVLVNNHYERSKAQAERLVFSRCTVSGLDFRILRPSIVIGPSATQRPGGATTGVYGFVRDLQRQRRALNVGTAIHRLDADPDVELNVIPVDHVVDPMLRLGEHGFPRGPVLHLTNPRSPRLGGLMTVVCELAGVRPVQLVPGHVPVTAIERRLARHFEFYSHYFREPKTFERSLPHTLSLTTAAALRPYLAAAVDATLTSAYGRMVRNRTEDPRPTYH